MYWRIETRQQAETDKASKDILKKVHKAFVTALRDLPPSEYLFFDIPRSNQSLTKDRKLNPTRIRFCRARPKLKREVGSIDSSALSPLLPIEVVCSTQSSLAQGVLGDCLAKSAHCRQNLWTNMEP